MTDRWCRLAKHKWRAANQEPAIRFFASSHQLNQLAPRTRILCALFLLGILAQAVSGVLMHHLGPGWTPTSVAAYYRGNERGNERGSDTTANPPAGDRFGLGGEGDSSISPPPPRTMHVARSFGTLVEVAHLHLVAMPLVLFVVAHLFSMTPLGRRALGGFLCYAGFVCAAADIVTPFAVRYLSAGFAPLKLAAFFGLEACLMVMVVVTLITCLTSFTRPPTTDPLSRAD